MKFVLDERDENFIRRVNEDINNGESPILYVNELNRKYYIEFECTDIGKANAFVHKLLGNHNDDGKDVEDNLGIRVNALNYKGLGDLTDIKEDLRKLLYKLDQM